ncbi:phage tail tape measure protein [Leclercia adecarboxylata]|uniref:phage tail tape measure protein n=1 Tax=Leclercia adecarboxylata TaxID=83655 RepID=UPI0011DFFCBC|nr:phage tail tape measure protein [Leclercia adecarboxylata]NEG91094.1 phage tail tape measure protein [Leclercia adecarboxylata]
MAGKSLGTLTIDLIAKVGGFVSGLSQAERASQKWRKQVQADANAVAVAFTGLATAASAAAIGAGVAGYNLLKTTSKQITETDRWAKSLNMSTQSLLAWQYAAEKAGVSGDQMADIFKDIGDKIGDAVLNKSGEAVDALNALGLSAKKLAGESPDKQLLAISNALGKINTNAEKTTILESLGNDLSKLLPLLDQGGEKLRQYMDAAKQFGVAPDDADIEKLVKINALFEDMETQVNGVKIEIATGLASVDLSGLKNAITDMGDVFKDQDVIQGLTDLVGGVVDLATWLVKVGAEAGKLIDLYKGGKAVSDGASVTDIERRLNNLRADVEDQGFLASFNRIGMDIDGKKAEIAQLERRLSIMKAGNNLPLSPATVGSPTAPRGQYSLGKGETNGKPTADTSAKKLETAFKSLEMSYQRQIALIDTTGKKNQEVTEIEKLRFDFTSGKLTGINEAQKERLEQLATEIDRLNSLKKANEENLKLAEFASNLRKQNQNDQAANDADFVGAGMGDKTRQRMKDLLDIQRSFLDRQADLQKQYQSGDISKSLYDQETAALQDALNERLEIQEDYYQKSDEQMGDWQSGILDSLNDYADSASDYYQIAADSMTSILGGATTSLADNLEDLITGAQGLGDFFSNIFDELGQTVIKTLTDMAAQWLVYQAVQLMVGRTSQASAAGTLIGNAQATSLQAQLAAYASTAAIPIIGPSLAPGAMLAAAAVTEPLVAAVGTSALAGMAHDGIDSVPETGTWLLQQGERVTTAKTSAKLDATLDRVNKQTGDGGGTYSPQIYINGDPDARTIEMLKQAVKEGAQLGYNMVNNDLATGKGKTSKSLSGGWGVRRKAG